MSTYKTITYNTNELRKLASILILFILQLLPLRAQHEMKKISIQVLIKQDGSARVKETREAVMSEAGTEGYITFNNMGDMQVRDVHVSDEKGIDYVVEEYWEVDRSRDEKQGRCGLHHTEEGVELCWGIGEAGHRVYVITYTLTNLVKAYDDYDGFCYSFYEAANTPPLEAQVDLALEGNSLNKENAGIWAFGFEGYKGFSNGFAGASCSDMMKEDDAIIILLQLKKGLLKPSSIHEGSFTETIKRKALEGSNYNLEDAGIENTHTSQDGGLNKVGGGATLMSNEDDSEDTLYTVFGIGMFLVIIYQVIKNMVSQRKERKRITALLLEKMGGKKYEDLPYWRQLPLKGNLLLSGATLSTIDTLMRRSSLKNIGIKFSQQQLYDAFVLRMIYKKSIVLAYDTDEKGNHRKLFRISKPELPQDGEDVTSYFDYDMRSMAAQYLRNEAIDRSADYEAITYYSGFLNDNGIEYQIHNLLYEAAGEDHLLQPKELKCYVEKEPLKWRRFAIVLNRLVTGCIGEGHLTTDNTQQVIGFLHYLRDFSLVAERNIDEVGLWKEYLVFASFYGIADQVRNDMVMIAPDVARLDELMPAIETIQDFRPLSSALTTTLRYAFTYQTLAEKKIIEERRRAAERESSSGGSGWSSYSGGGGHSGGGGSGFR